MKNTKSFQNLLSAVQKAKNGTPSQKNDDSNFWKAETDKAGNGYAIIRFLPGKAEDDTPFVKTYNHGFQGPAGKWFIEQCPTTVGDNCPVCTANGPLWNSGIDKDKEIVRQRKRRVSYVANVLVVSDPKNPDNEGKVFLFKFGQKIFDKLVDKLQPPVDEKGNLIDPDDEPMNPFDPVEGANFKLKIRKVEGYSNFDKSEFEKVSEVQDWESVESQIHDLGQFTDPKSFKSYEELEKKFNLVVGGTTPSPKAAARDDDEDYTPAPKAAKPEPKKVVKEESEEDDDLAYFAKLAEDD